MSKQKVLFCPNCGRYTKHIFAGHESAVDGGPIIRAICAVCTLGISETAAARRFYECQKCGDIHEK